MILAVLTLVLHAGAILRSTMTTGLRSVAIAAIPPFAVRDLALLARGFALVRNRARDEYALTRGPYLVGSSKRFLDLCQERGWVAAVEDDANTGLTAWEVTDRGLQALRKGGQGYEVPVAQHDVVLAAPATWVTGAGEPAMFVKPLTEEILADLNQRLAMAEYLFLRDPEIVEIHLSQDIGAFVFVPNWLLGEPFRVLEGGDHPYFIAIDAEGWFAAGQQGTLLHRKLPFKAKMQLVPGAARWHANEDDNLAIKTASYTRANMQKAVAHLNALIGELEQAAKGEIES